jgi:alpha-tubulin suppressor-like RCC1 family protein
MFERMLINGRNGGKGPKVKRFGSGLYGWGLGTDGQLGLGEAIDVYQPNKINLEGNWNLLTSSVSHTILSNSDGVFYGFGNNSYGALGFGTGKILTPIILENAQNWKSIKANNLYTLAIKEDGTLWSWGYNAQGQLGQGNTNNKFIPTQVGTDSDWKSISAGLRHSLAIKENGTLWTWGSNSSGRTGLNSTSGNTLNPTQVGSDSDWKEISAGGSASIAIKEDGTLWAAGWNGSGMLGNGTTATSSVFIQSGTDTDWKFVSVGLLHSVGLKIDGTLWTWGRGADGETGDGLFTVNTTSPNKISNEIWKNISASNYYCMAIREDGELWGWGKNQVGEIGIGNTDPVGSPTFTGISDCISVSTGGFSTIAIVG